MAFFRVRSLWALSKCKSSLVPSPTQTSSHICRFSSSKSTQIESVGFIGTGNMGCHMANNLIKAGYQVTIHDANHNVMKMFEDKGVPTRETPSGVAETSDVVITMLPSPFHFICQGGDFTAKNGTGGESIYSTKVKDEFFIYTTEWLDVVKVFETAGSDNRKTSKPVVVADCSQLS